MMSTRSSSAAQSPARTRSDSGATVVKAIDLQRFEAVTLKGETVSLGTWAGQVLLVVNTASRCGFTPQYAGLQALQDRFGARGFSVLGFPCNQFGAQEPGDATAIATFCHTSFDVSFPLFAKVEVNGPGAHPLWQALTKAQAGTLGLRAIKWNFTKFLINRQGAVVGRFGPMTNPESVSAHIEALL